MRRMFAQVLAGALLSAAAFAGNLSTGNLAAGYLAKDFADPPADTRPLVRWWWFGPSVENTEIVREIDAMKAGGFGGFELQTVYPLSLDGNVPFLSDAYLKSVRLANDTARERGLRVDMTLGSGWPFGGPHIPVDLAATGLKLVQRDVPAHAATVDLPALHPGEHVLAAFLGKDMTSARPVAVSGSRLVVRSADAGRSLFVVLQSPTGQQVKRAAVGAEGNVLDHMSRAAVKTHLSAVGDKLLSAFGDHPPYAVFSDSLEVFHADWSSDVLAEFRRRRGYDLQPHMLELFENTPESAAVRRDWGRTLSDLADENYLSPVTDWAHRHHTRFRSQTYGYPPVTLASNRLVDLAEGEGIDWRAFSASRWASSANHIYGNPVTSAESWTWLHSGAFQATPLDVKVVADILMLEGINQFVAHGWPYSPPSAGEPGWAFYAAAAFGDHNPWWGVMADVNRYLQRMSYLLRQGTPVTDVAVFLPEDDAFAAMRPGKPSINTMMSRFIPATLTEQILDAGYGFDFVDARTILDKGVAYKVLVLPNVSRMSLQTMARIAAYARAGGHVLFLGKAPDLAPGLMHAAADGKAVRDIVRRMQTLPSVKIVAAEDLGRALRAELPPDLAGAPPALGFVHRKTPEGDLYFVVNTANRPLSADLRFRDGTAGAEWWDARTGEAHAWRGGTVTLAPYESRVFVFGGAASAPPSPAPVAGHIARALTKGWTIAFAGGPAEKLTSFASWTDMPERRFYSGVVTYACDVTLDAADIASGLDLLDFGAGTPVTPPSAHLPGMRALLASPVRETVEVYVNGKRAGAVWAPPYALSLRGLLHPGRNRLELRVANTAVNLLASRPPTDYRALTAKYGTRFEAQNMDGLAPQPSGLLHPPVLRSMP